METSIFKISRRNLGMSKAALGSILITALAFPAHAGTTDTWKPTTSGAWNTASNWTGNNPPQATDDATFSTTATGTITSGNTDVADGLVFSNTGSLVLGTAASTGTLTLGGDGITVNSGTNTINTSLILGASQVWTNNTTSTLTPLTFNGVVNNGGFTLTFSGAGNFSTGNSANISGTGGMIVAGTGTVTLNSDSSSFSGPLVINSGATVAERILSNIGQSSSIGAGSAGGSAADLVIAGTLDEIRGNPESTNRLFTIGNATGTTATILNTAGDPLDFTGTGALAFGGTGNHALVLGGTAVSYNVFDPQITDAGTGTTTSLSKTGVGTWSIGGTNNTYSGGTSVTGGTLYATTSAALGTGAVTVTGSTGTVALDYFSNTDAQLNLGSTLALNGGGTGTVTAIGSTIGSTATSSQINVAGVVTGTGTVTVNIYANSAVTSTPLSNYTLITGASGSTFGSKDVLGFLYDDTNFTIGASPFTTTGTSLSVAVTAATPLTAAYWTGSLGTPNNTVWAVSNGTGSNWALTSGGSSASQPLVPGAGATVNFTGSTAATGLTLGANMSIAGLNVQNTGGMTLGSDGNTLTIGAGGITANASAATGTTTIAANIALSASQVWTNSATVAANITGNVAFGSGNNLTLTTTSGTLVVSGTLTGTGNLIINNDASLANSVAVTAATGTTTFNENGTITNSGTGGGTSIGAVLGSNITSVTETSTSSTLTLSAANSFGALNILAGTVSASTSATALGAGTVTLGNTTGSSAATLLVTGGLNYGNAIVLATNSNATLTIGDAGTTSPNLTGGVTGNNSFSINDSNTAGITFATNPVNNVGTITNIGTGAGGATISGGVGSNVTAITENSTTSALSITTTALTVNSGSTTLTNSNASGTSLFTVSGGISGTGGLILNNNSSIASGITISTGSVTNTGSITNTGSGSGSTLISSNISSNVSLVTENSTNSGLVLSGSNNFGTLNVQSGTATLNGANSGGAGTITVGNASGTTATLLGGGVTIANGITLASGDTAGTLTLGSTSAASPTFSGAINLNGDNLNITAATGQTTTIATGGISGTGDLTLTTSGTGGITFNTVTVSNQGTILNNGSGTGTVVFKSAAVIGTNVTAVTQDSSTVAMNLGGADTFSGAVNVTLGTLLVTNNTGLISTDTVTVNGGTFNNDIATLTIAGLNDGGVSTGVVSSSLASSNVLTIGGNGTYSYSGVINAGSGTTGLTITGGATQTLSGLNTYTGSTTIANGELSINTIANTSTSSAIGAPTTAALGTIGIGATTTTGTLVYTGSGNVSNRVINLAGTTGGAVLNDSGTGTLEFSSALTATGAGNKTLGLTGSTSGVGQLDAAIVNGSTGVTSVTKSGTGEWILGGSSSYTGSTTVAGGNLQVIGSIASGSAVTVGNNTATVAILSGTGTLSGSLATSTTGTNIAYIAPGVNTSGTRGDFGSVGTLHVGTLGFTIGAGTQFDYDINTATTAGGTSNDLIAMGGSGVLTIGGSGIVFNFDQLSALSTTGSYTLISGAGSVSGFSAADFSATGIGTDTATFTSSGGNLYVSFGTGGPTFTTGTYTLTSTVGATLLHVGATTTATTTLTNTGTGSADSLNYTGLGSTGGTGTVTGTAGAGGPVANAGGTAVATQTYTALTAGTDTVTPTGTVTGANSTPPPVDTGTATATIQVYSGTGSWTGTAGGVWGTAESSAPANWTAIGGIPGITPGFLTTDSASFGNSSTTQTITLSGASPYLNNITFNNTLAGSYTIAQGGTGTIHLENSGTSTATLVDSAGSNTISAPVELDSAASTSVATSDTLTISGNVSQGVSAEAMTVGGAGTTVLSGSNTYTGGTTVNTSATLLVSNTVAGGSATGSGALSVGNGATIGGYGTSSGTSFSVSGTGTATGQRANVLVGLNSASDTNTSQVLTLIGSGASTIQNANLTFNLKVGTSGALGSDPSGSGTELAVGNTKITFGGATGSVLFSLNMQNEPGIVTAFTPYVLIAGTLPTGGGGVDGSQYTGLTLGNVLVSTGTVTETIIDSNGTNNLAVAFGNSTDQGYYGANSYLVLYQNTATGADDIDVVVVPEPGTWALMLGGLAFLVFWQRRKSSK